MSLTPIKVTIQKPVRTGDGSGGKRVSWVTDSTGYATQNYYGKRYQLVHEEQGAHGTGGPGLDNDKLQLFVFHDLPFPTILAEYRIVTPDGATYTVKWVRAYDTTMQVDTEIIGL